MKGVIFRCVLGGVGGFLGWALIEPTAPAGGVTNPAWGPFEVRMTLVCCGLIGCLLASWNAYQQGGRARLVRDCLLGAIAGMFTGFIGYEVGGGAAVAVAGPEFYNRSLIHAIVGRVIVGCGLGTALGCGIGLVTGNRRRIALSTLGGLAGGCIGGLLFDTIGHTFGSIPLAMGASGTQEVGQVSRGLLFTVMGAAIGLCIGAVEQLAKEAWIRLVLGRNEGREWILDKQVTVIGRDERADIPLFGDPQVAANHASIVKHGDLYWLFDAGSPTGTFVDGQRVGQGVLQSGSTIQIGGQRLEFMLRRGSAARAAEKLRSGQILAPQSPHPAVGTSTVVPAAAPAAPVAPVAPVRVPAAAPTQALAAPTLEAISGPLAGQTFPLSGGLELGRETSGIRIPGDPNVSRRHVLIETTPLGVSIRDLGSTNGTFINDRRVTESPLMVGDILRVGSSEFRLKHN